MASPGSYAYGKTHVMVGSGGVGGRSSGGRGAAFRFLALGAFQFFPAEVDEPVADVDQVRRCERDCHHDQVRRARARTAVELNAR